MSFLLEQQVAMLKDIQKQSPKNGQVWDVKSLSLTSKSYRDKEIDQLLSWADIIYVGGGDTISMMQTWKKYGVDEKLKQIYEKDSAVLTGISAGAICWFYCGHSDSEASHNKDDERYCWATGMLDIFHMAYWICNNYFIIPAFYCLDQMSLIWTFLCM